MQAIILAAGMGRRLGEYSRENTKCMVLVNGVRLIDRALNQLSGLNLNRVVIVEGYKGEELKRYIGNRYDDRLRIEFVHNPVYDKTNNIYSLALAKDKLSEDDTLLLESDLIFDDNLLPLIMNNPNPNLALVAKYETWMDGTMVRLDQDMNIVNFISKQAFSYREVSDYYKTVNIYKFSKDFLNKEYIPLLDAYCSIMGNNEYYEQVLRVVTMLRSTSIKALPLTNEKWYEIDDALDLDIAETLFADHKEMFDRFNYRYGGHWRFPKLLDFCYLVNPFFPPERLRSEMRNSFDQLISEYPSGMEVNVLLASNYFHIDKDYVVVGNGAAELIKSLMENIKGRLGVIYPTFEEYPHRVAKERIVAFEPDNEELRYDENDLMGFFNDKDIDTLLLINPDNPSGNFIGKEGLVRLIDWSREKGIGIVIDESFVDFSDDFLGNTLIKNSILESYERLYVVKSISKSYGVPGLRLGILASSDSRIIMKIRRDVSIWNINSFAEFYMQIFSKYSSDYVSACNKFIAERSRFKRLLEGISWLKVLPSQANFFCVKVNGRYSSQELSMRLLSDYNIMIKDCDCKNGLKGKNYIRLSVRNAKDNDALIAALKDL